MRLLPNLTWFAALLESRARRPVRCDPANMGTALALDSITIVDDLEAALAAEAKAPSTKANDGQRCAERRSRL